MVGWRNVAWAVIGVVVVVLLVVVISKLSKKQSSVQSPLVK